MTALLTKQQILDELSQCAGELHQRFQVKQLGLFGSYVRNEADATSDIDLLVDFVTPTFDNYMNTKFYLEERFGRKVDLVTVGALKPRVAAVVLTEVHPIEIG